jgi:ribose-phosphate pyrophosphokinase
VYAFASHGLFSGAANERIASSKLEEVVVLNTIPLNTALETNAKIVQVTNYGSKEGGVER